MRQVPCVQGSRGGQPACLLYRPRPINTIILYADNPDIVRDGRAAQAAAWSPVPSSSRNWRAASSSAVRIASPPDPFRSSTVTFAVGDRKTRDVSFFALA